MARSGNIAVVLAGWNSEHQTRAIEGILSRAKETGYSVSLFTCQSGVELSEQHVRGESKIYSLINLQRFDGVILMTNTIWDKFARDYVIDMIRESGVPCVSIEMQVDGMGFVGIDNYEAMMGLLQHLKEHNYRPIHFLAGPQHHYENGRRQAAFEDFVAEQGYPEDECEIWYGDYSYESGGKVVDAMLGDDNVPRAIVCANDQMALGACARLKQRGYRIPQDVAITGFDGTYDVEEYIPGITTVDRPKRRLGCEAFDILLDEMEQRGEQSIADVRCKMESTLLIMDSCGCKCEPRDPERIVEKLYLSNVKEGRYNFIIRTLEDSMMECETLQELVYCLRQKMSTVAQEDMYLCLNQSVYDEMAGKGDAQFRQRNVVKEYESRVYMTKISREDGVPAFTAFDTELMFPGIWDPGRGELDNYLFVPLHFQENCIGYLVLTGNIATDRVPTYYIWVRNISHTLQNLQNTLRLKGAIRNIEAMALRDSLTGVYNRQALKRFVADMVERANNEKRRLLFLFADVDYLKKINDVYGHEAGDAAICMAADALRQIYEKAELIIRYGGDEFLIVTEHYTKEQAEEKRKKVRRLLQQWVEEHQLPYPMSISIGCYCKDADTTATMEEYIECADANMYENKCKNRNPAGRRS